MAKSFSSENLFDIPCEKSDNAHKENNRSGGVLNAFLKRIGRNKSDERLEASKKKMKSKSKTGSAEDRERKRAKFYVGLAIGDKEVCVCSCNNYISYVPSE